MKTDSSTSHQPGTKVPESPTLSFDANQALLDALFDQQVQFMALLTPEGRIVRANHPPLGIEALNGSDFTGKLLWNTPPWSHLPEAQEKIRLHLRQAASMQATLRVEEIYETLEGTIRYADAAYIPIRDDQRVLRLILIQATDITAHKRHQQVLAARLALTDFAATHSASEVLQRCLDEAERLTDSRVGFFHFLDSDENMLSLQAWSSRTLGQMCSAKGKGMHYPVSQAGVWVDAVRERKPVIHNDYVSLPHRKGLPDGHAPVVRELVVPVFREKRIVALLGVGNKPGDYDEEDIRTVNDIADMAWDIVLRKKAEEQMHTSQARYQQIVETANEGIWAMDGDRRTTFVNPIMARMLGYTPAQMAGRRIDSFMFEDDRARVDRGFCQAVDGLRCERRFRCKDGSEIWTELSVNTPVLGRNENSGIFAMLTDITERKRSEAALRERHNQFLAVLDGMDAAIYVSDLQTGEILFMNKSKKESFGGDMTGRLCYQAFRGISEPCSFCPKNGLLDDDGHPKKVHVWEDHNSITSRWYLNQDRAIEWVDGRLAKLQVGTDITPIKEMEAERQEYRTRIQQMQKLEAIGTLAGGIAHDFNNILTAVIGYTEIALDDDPSVSSGARKSLDNVLTAAFRARELVKQILAFSRQTHSEKKSILLEPIIKESMKLLRASLPATIEMRHELASPDARILGDPTQIQQVLMNLCANAAQAMRAAGGSLVVGLERIAEDAAPDDRPTDLAPGALVRLTVTDTGPGMSSEIMEQVFDPFFTTKSKQEGTGLGLSVVHGIVNDHGGRVTVASRVGQGTTFTLFFPDEPTPQADLPAEDEVLPGGSEHILLVEDEAPIAEATATMLQRLGYRVTTATGSGQAWVCFLDAPRRFDLVMTDQTMPQMTGDELARRMLAIRPDLPVILMTGFSHLVDEETAKALGIREFIMKPVSRRDLATAVRRVLSNDVNTR